MTPPAKKPRVEANEKPGPGLQAHPFLEESQERLEREVAASGPYQHGVIHGLLDDDLLRRARNEMMTTVTFTPKETDIYRLNQTGDLRNLDGLPQAELAQLQNLAKVRAALYSPEFRTLISRVTQCGPLSGKIQDLSINMYDRGCHLLNHDDVIGTRRVSFILYLVPPDEPWDPKWGGALRLYPTVRAGVPSPDWSVSVPPAWNQLSFFQIKPGHSFHDVEEVYVDKGRLSIQGWFHVPQEGEPGYDEAKTTEEADRENATLAQLSRSHDNLEGYLPQRQFSPIEKTSEKDQQRQFDVKKYVSRDILDKTTELADQFASDSILELDGFLEPEFARRVLKEAEAADLDGAPATSAQVEAPWAVARPPHIRRYLYLEKGANGALAELRDFLASSEFATVLENITTLKPTEQYVEARRFRPGHDYTLASVSGVDTPILEAVVSVTPAKWNDDLGGYDLIMAGGDGNDDPAVYRAASDDDGPLISTLPTQNKLVLVLRDPDLLRFVKYVSRNAPGSRWDILAQYKTAE